MFGTEWAARTIKKCRALGASFFIYISMEVN